VPAGAYAVRRPLGRVWGFTLLSFGLYGGHWFYVTRRLLDGELALGRDDAALHTVGLVVPVLNFFVVYWLWRDLNALRLRVVVAIGAALLVLWVLMMLLLAVLLLLLAAG
jgi:hypothetical protein